MSELNNWVPSELPTPNRKTSLVDDIADIFETMWNNNIENFRTLASSTDKDDAVEGTVAIDKILLARLIKQAAGEGSRVGNAKVGDIARVMHHAAKRYGVDRKSIAARKAEYRAVEQARPAQPTYAN